MKERLIEDWLTRISERGYQTAFGQILAAKGYTILRIGHSPYEHGKDVIAIAPDGDVCCYQLKDGDIGLKDWERGYSQLVALVETRPRHPSLPEAFTYRPCLVTSGLLTDPATDRLSSHNAEWLRRGLPQVQIIDGRWLCLEFAKLSNDFWPEAPPDVRRFRSLYLVDGRGDFDVETFASFLKSQLSQKTATVKLERNVAAVNLFSSYILSEFYRNEDHWSVFRGWVMTAARIAWVAEFAGVRTTALDASFKLAREAAQSALTCLARECVDAESFKPSRIEWDEYTRIRNVTALAAWSALCLLCPEDTIASQNCLSRLLSFFDAGRITIWGEGCLSQFCCFWWLLERNNLASDSRCLMLRFLQAVVANQKRDNPLPLSDPYVSAEETLKRIVELLIDREPKQPVSVQSYSLLPLILLFVNRGYRSELADHWKKISHITMTVFTPESPCGYLEWSCENGAEKDQIFPQPESWQALVRIAEAPAVEKLPEVLKDDPNFRLMFLLAFPHRLNWSLIGSMDSFFRNER